MNEKIRNLLIVGGAFTLLGALTYSGGIGDVNQGRGRTRMFKALLSWLADLLGSEQTIGVLLLVIGVLFIGWVAVA